jgi:serine protease AprX
MRHCGRLEQSREYMSERAIRSSALWGRGGRALAAGLFAAVALALPLEANATPGGHSAQSHVSAALLRAAQNDPQSTFDVIVQGADSTDATAAALAADQRDNPGKAKGLKQRFGSLAAVSAELTGKQIEKLADRSDIVAITPDSPVSAAGHAPYNAQLWPYYANVQDFWASNKFTPPPMPTIAIVDSGIDTSRADVAGRVLKQVVLTNRTPNSPGDGRGHGTYVASIAAGAADGHAGVLPTANLVSLDVLDDTGQGTVSDLLAACDWILQNKTQYGIRVANFSLVTTNDSSFIDDPLDKAVEKLWFNGVVVVAAAGNYGLGSVPSGVRFAPANDPFVITVGAEDLGPGMGGTARTNSPWSAWGYTHDGFRKPELGAPGRYMIGAAPTTSTMSLERPDRIVSPGYMRMSGTSFAAPVVAGAAAALLGFHPSWTPDQVKGALMVSAATETDSNYVPLSLGVGLVQAKYANAVADPPNPNAALEQFVTSDPAALGTSVFDAASWESTANANASWDSASWDSASWDSASWDSASWDSASWDSASWDSASWDSASWDSASWDSASWESLLWID